MVCYIVVYMCVTYSRDVSGVELLMNSHRSLMAEIDAREENFSICLSLGRTLLNRRHPQEEEVRKKCIQVIYYKYLTTLYTFSRCCIFVFIFYMTFVCVCFSW